MHVFTQKKNPITGATTWDVQREDYDYHQEIARSAFADMLHDTERNKKYELALKSAINHMHGKGKPANVLDIGTGSGLLSIMAVRCGADSVTACEAFKPMAECAAKVMSHNGVADKINLIPKRSTELVVGADGDLKERANILVAEVFDTELIGEGAISTFSHATKHLLDRDCIIVPDAAVVYAQVVSCPQLQEWNKLQDLIFNGETILSTPEKMKDCPGSAAVHDLQLGQISQELFTPLSEPIPIFYFDWKNCVNKKNNVKQLFTPINSGSAQMIFMWWELLMDIEGTISLSCAPWWCHPDIRTSRGDTQSSVQWRDHWMQAVYYLPQEVYVTVDREIGLIGCHDEYSLWFYLDNNKLNICERPVCECGVHMAYSRTHVSYLNDKQRSEKFLSQLKSVIDDDSVVLDVNGSSLRGLAASKFGAKKLYILENLNLNMSIIDDYAKNNNIGNITFINELSKEVLGQITHVICDPSLSDSLLPWENLKIAYLLEKHKDQFSKTVNVIPDGCSFYAMPVEFLDLHKIRMPLGVCEGIDHTIFDKHIEASRQISDEELEPQPLWEYPCYCRGEPKQLLSLNFRQLENSISKLDSFFICENGEYEKNWKVNAFAVWCVWNINDELLSSGPIATPVLGELVKWDTHTRQAVKLFKNVEEVTKNRKWCYEMVCDLNKAEFKLNIELSPPATNGETPMEISTEDA